MTLELILTRHAKSSWDHPGMADHDRPLNDRGQASATAMGNWLRARGLVPDAVLSSSSVRTRQTHDLMGFDAPATFTGDLFHAGALMMLEVLGGARGARVLLLGHNPGIGDLAERLATTPPDHPRFFDYPTCATTVFRFEADNWREVTFGAGEVVDFAIPREVLAE